jgi:TPR repeat protein
LAQNQDTTAALVLACDQAAASPTDKDRPVGLAGVPSGRLDSQNAIAACEAAAAAAPDNPRIIFQLGRAHAAAKADESARAYFSKASDLGYAAAQASLGLFYAIGRGGLARNDDEALRLSRLAAEQGDPIGNNNLGFFYETGRGGLAKDDREAARLYQLAADSGESWGQYNLGRLYQNGRGGLTQNDREAAGLFRLAADQGHDFAEVSLGFFYQTGQGGLPKDDLKAVGYYKRAADQGNAGAQVSLGFFYETGRGGLAKDDREAARLYQLAADQGNAAGRNTLGRFYQLGRGGLPQSDQEAAPLYRLAAEQGYVFAQFNLGFFYETGRGGLPQDEVEAARLYRLAAEQGEPIGQNKLATFYEEGRGGLPKDNREAARLYKLASEQDRNLNAKQQASDALTRLGLAPAVASPSAPAGVRTAIPVIGFLDTNAPSANWFGINAFRSALKEAGYVEGKNVAIDFRWTYNEREMHKLAADMVRRHVDIIVANGGLLAARAAKAATDTVPIIIVGGADPVRTGLVASMNRPGGNVTGITTIVNQLAGKRLELLLGLVPDATTIGYLVNVNGGANGDTKALLEAARRVGREVIVVECRGEADFEVAFEKLSQRQAGGLMVSAFPLASNNRNKIVALAARYKIPTIYPLNAFAYQGGLISYMALLMGAPSLISMLRVFSRAKNRPIYRSRRQASSN